MKLKGTVLHEYQDCESGEEERFTPGGRAVVFGENLGFDPADPACGLFFICETEPALEFRPCCHFIASDRIEFCNPVRGRYRPGKPHRLEFRGADRARLPGFLLPRPAGLRPALFRLNDPGGNRTLTPGAIAHIEGRDLHLSKDALNDPQQGLFIRDRRVQEYIYIDPQFLTFRIPELAPGAANIRLCLRHGGKIRTAEIKNIQVLPDHGGED